MRCFQRSILFLAVVSLSASTASAQVLFTSELDSDAGWTIVADEDTAYEFGFDYTTLGIPKNPNSSSESTTGLKMSANIVEPGAPAAISATPSTTFSGSYRLEADFWLNYNSSGGTTEYIGGFVGYDPAGAPVNGIGLLGDSDGDSGSDYRVYDAGAQVSARNNSEAELTAAFPGGTTPEAQSDAALFDPTNVSVTAPDGTLGFGWHTLAIEVDGGSVDLAIDGISMGTVDGSADGSIALGFADLFNSVSNKPEFSFGVFDNVSVSQVPEPNGFALVALGLVGIAAFRRRR